MRFGRDDDLDADDLLGAGGEAINFNIGMKDRVSPESKKVTQAFDEIGKHAKGAQERTQKLGTAFGLTQQQMTRAVQDAMLRQRQSYKNQSELIRDTQENYAKLYKKQFEALGNLEKLAPKMASAVRKWTKEHNLALADAKPIVAQVLTDKQVEEHTRRLKKIETSERELYDSLSKITGGKREATSSVSGGEEGTMPKMRDLLGKHREGDEEGGIQKLIDWAKGLSGEKIIGGILGIQALRASFKWDDAMTRIRRQIGMTDAEYKKFADDTNIIAIKQNLLPEEAEAAAQIWAKLGNTFADNHTEITVLGKSLANLKEAANLNDEEAKQLLLDYSAFAKTPEDFKELTDAMTIIRQATTLTHGEMIGVYSAAKPFARLVKDMGGDSSEVLKNFGKTSDYLKQKGLQELFGGRSFEYGDKFTSLVAARANVAPEELIKQQLMGGEGYDKLIQSFVDSVSADLGLQKGAKANEIAEALAGPRAYGLTQQLGVSRTNLMQILSAHLEPGVAKGGTQQDAAFKQAEAKLKADGEAALKVRSFTDEMEHAAGYFNELSFKVLGPGVLEGTQFVGKLNEISRDGGTLDDFKDAVKRLLDFSIEYYDKHGGAAGKAVAGSLRGIEEGIDLGDKAAKIPIVKKITDWAFAHPLELAAGYLGIRGAVGAGKMIYGAGKHFFGWGGGKAATEVAKKTAPYAWETIEGAGHTASRFGGLSRFLGPALAWAQAPWMYVKGLNLIEKFQKTSVGGAEKDWEQSIYQRLMPWGPGVKSKMSDKELHAINMMKMGGGGNVVPFAKGGALSRAPKEWQAAIIAAAQRHGLDPEKQAAQLEAESGWDQFARGTSGERGLAQFMPQTGEKYGLMSDKDYFDPMKSIEANAAHMQDLIRKYGSYEKALWAYNTGKGYATAAGKDYEKKVLMGTSKALPMHVSVQDDLLAAIKSLPDQLALRLQNSKVLPPPDRLQPLRVQRVSGG